MKKTLGEGLDPIFPRDALLQEIVFVDKSIEFLNSEMKPIGTFLMSFLNKSIEERDGVNIFGIPSTHAYEVTLNLQNNFRNMVDFCFNINKIDYLKSIPPLKLYYLYTQNENLEIVRLNEHLEVHYDVIPLVEKLNIETAKKTIQIEQYMKNGNTKSAVNLIKHMPLYRIPRYKSINIYSLLYASLRELIFNENIIKKCENPECRDYFVVRKRVDTEYCDKCKVVGSVKKYQDKVEKDDYLKLYQTVYKSRHAKLRKITNPNTQEEEKEKLIKWRKVAKDIADNKTMTLQEYKEWLKQ